MEAQQNLIRWPDLSLRPFQLYVEKVFPFQPDLLYNAFTSQLDLWFAAQGSLITAATVNTPFFFETEFQPDGAAAPIRHPHYGRFLNLVPNFLVEFTWLTGAGGTKGAETILSVTLVPEGQHTLLKLAHKGFADEESMNNHKNAWPMVLEMLENVYSSILKQ